jgi:hypothetical protein
MRARHDARRARRARLAATLVAVSMARNRLCRAIRRPIDRGVHMFASGPSDRLRSLRTHVPRNAQIQACAARARCCTRGPLVPVARGRLRGRLGGRPGRAQPRPASPSSAAAQRVRAQASGPDPGACAAVPIAGRAGGAGAATWARTARRAVLDPDMTTGRPKAARVSKKPAASYSPRPLRAKYHRR